MLIVDCKSIALQRNNSNSIAVLLFRIFNKISNNLFFYITTFTQL